MSGVFGSGFGALRGVFAKTRSVLGKGVSGLFSALPDDDEAFEESERALYEADVGATLAEELTARMRAFRKKHRECTREQLREELKTYVREVFGADSPSISEEDNVAERNTRMFLVVGVNGSGKTTSCAKLGARAKAEGKTVMLAAGDTFRAAGAEQLNVWADRIGVDCVAGEAGGDPAAVIFDALTAARARNIDLLIADTAGRLQSKTDLMRESEKIVRASGKVDPTAPHEIYLSLDATTGRNAIDQAVTFNKFTPLTGLILTKSDGSAKGGIALAVFRATKIPIRFIGTGEGLTDLISFDPDEYVNALF
ncbi:MAG: signal recognition particle-docking protein FtsY [Simkaniaceae bacterium]|nr:signal recognition particle-docking protein FtsY [Simkaniaceae bacterium]